MAEIALPVLNLHMPIYQSHVFSTYDSALEYFSVVKISIKRYEFVQCSISLLPSVHNSVRITKFQFYNNKGLTKKFPIHELYVYESVDRLSLS